MSHTAIQHADANKVINNFRNNFYFDKERRLIAAVSATAQQNDVHADLKTCVPAVNLAVIQCENNHAYLRVEVIQKMIRRLLFEKRMSEEKLAEILGVTVKSIKRICSKQVQTTLIAKINLPLVKLYCRTRF